jgi:hypothetical protein
MRYVKCIDKGNNEDLTKNKIYKLVETFNFLYYVIDDSGYKGGFFEHRFIDYDYRKEKLERIL